MLCEACSDIFAEPRRLGYAVAYPWKQTRATYSEALNAGCRLCSIIEECRNANGSDGKSFPDDAKYSFKALNTEWASSGTTANWRTPEWMKRKNADNVVHTASKYPDGCSINFQPTELANCLAADFSGVQNVPDFWIVLEFDSLSDHAVLPLELITDNGIPDFSEESLEDQTSTKSSQTLDMAKSWLQSCTRSHEACCTFQGPRRLPTRLIDVGTPDENRLRLVETHALAQDIPYAALSYRWPEKKENQHGVLTSATLEAYKVSISHPGLPLAVKEAAEIARSLGIAYLWADSICIVQDDSADFTRECETMYQVYGQAVVTLVAANSSDDTGCFTTRDARKIRPCLIPSPFKQNSKLSFRVMPYYLEHIYNKEVRQSSWHDRGWVFQERTLSSRLLIFGKTQLLWACAERQAAETWPYGKTNKFHMDRFESFTTDKDRFQQLLDGVNSVKHGHAGWWSFIQDYPTSGLTRSSDRLAALRGVANQIQHITGKQYCAGFWMNDSLSAALLWQKMRPSKSSSEAYIAPSWSWASHVGEIKFSKDMPNSQAVASFTGRDRIYEKGDRVPREFLHVSGFLVPALLLTDQVSDYGIFFKPTSLMDKVRLRIGIRKYRSQPVLANRLRPLAQRATLCWAAFKKQAEVCRCILGPASSALSALGRAFKFVLTYVGVVIFAAAILLWYALVFGSKGFIVMLGFSTWLLNLILISCGLKWVWFSPREIEQRIALGSDRRRLEKLVANSDHQQLKNNVMTGTEFHRLELGFMPPHPRANRLASPPRTFAPQASMGRYVSIRCNLDTELQTGAVNIYLLPLVYEFGPDWVSPTQVQGLVVHLVVGDTVGDIECYSRLGTFVSPWSDPANHASTYLKRFNIV